MDGRARTERITDSSSTTVSTSHNNNGGGGLITEVTIQPHNELGTFVDSSDGGSGSPPPPPHPPRLSNSQQVRKETYKINQRPKKNCYKYYVCIVSLLLTYLYKSFTYHSR